MKSKLLIATLLSCCCAMPAASTPAQAAFSDFMKATCGATCSDPVGEQQSATQNWQALTSMGTTSYIGGQIGDFMIDASSLLAGARQAGAVELDRWLRTGEASSPDISDAILKAVTSTSGIDVSQITGSKYLNGTQQTSSATTGNGVTILDSFSNSNDGLVGPGLGGGNFCTQEVDSALNAGSQSYVNSVVSAAEDKEFGFSQVGNVPVSADKHSDSGLFGGSCLSTFMQGNMDTLFKPPQLSQLVSMLTNMFGQGGQGGGSGSSGGGLGVFGGGGGSGSGGNCATSPTVFQQVNNSMPNAAFTPGLGGFFPYSNYGAPEDGMTKIASTNDPFNLLSKGNGIGKGADGGLSGLF